MDILSITLPVPTVFIYVAVVLTIVLIAKFIIRFIFGG